MPKARSTAWGRREKGDGAEREGEVLHSEVKAAEMKTRSSGRRRRRLR